MFILHFYEQIMCTYVIIFAQKHKKSPHLAFLPFQKSGVA